MASPEDYPHEARRFLMLACTEDYNVAYYWFSRNYKRCPRDTDCEHTLSMLHQLLHVFNRVRGSRDIQVQLYPTSFLYLWPIIANRVIIDRALLYIIYTVRMDFGLLADDPELRAALVEFITQVGRERIATANSSFFSDLQARITKDNIDDLALALALARA